MVGGADGGVEPRPYPGAAASRATTREVMGVGNSIGEEHRAAERQTFAALRDK